MNELRELRAIIAAYWRGRALRRAVKQGGCYDGKNKRHRLGRTLEIRKDHFELTNVWIESWANPGIYITSSHNTIGDGFVLAALPVRMYGKTWAGETFTTDEGPKGWEYDPYPGTLIDLASGAVVWSREQSWMLDALPPS